jgi:hypothetical protein
MRCRSGQLALMDALVFFMVAVTISSVLLFYFSGNRGMSVPDHGPGSADPNEVLESLLHSSIGIDETVNLGVERHLSSRTSVDQCLLIEAEAILDGQPRSAFRSIEEAIWSILERLCTPVFAPYLSVWWMGEDFSEAVIRIPSNPPASDQAFGACVELVNSGVEILLAQLLLCPSALPEVIDVLSGHLDLCAGICTSPAELVPRDGHHHEYENECQVEVVPLICQGVDKQDCWRKDVQEVQRVSHPSVWYLDRSGIAQAYLAPVPYLVPVLHSHVLAFGAVEELHARVNDSRLYSSALPDITKEIAPGGDVIVQ